MDAGQEAILSDRSPERYMTKDRTSRLGREALIVLAIFVASVTVIPPIVAAIAYQSGQAMFWPAFKSLYTYFLPYTLGAGVVVTLLAAVIRAMVKKLTKSETDTPSHSGRD